MSTKFCSLCNAYMAHDVRRPTDYEKFCKPCNDKVDLIVHVLVVSLIALILAAIGAALT